jgi:hypothetical protein
MIMSLEGSMSTEDKMSIDERRKYLRQMKKRYEKAGRKEKGQLLDEMEAVTELDRKTLIRLMKGGSEPRKLDSMLSKKPMIYCNQRRFTWPRNDGPLHQTSSSRSYWNC